jgi:transposase
VRATLPPTPPFDTKIHVRTEGGGKPLVLLLMEGQRHEQTAFEALMVDGTVRRYSRGRPRHRPGRLVGDKGYSGRHVRRSLRRHGIALAIPYRHHERWGRPVDQLTYRERNRVERCIHWIKQFRRVATCVLRSVPSTTWRWSPSPLSS